MPVSEARADRSRVKATSAAMKAMTAGGKAMTIGGMDGRVSGSTAKAHRPAGALTTSVPMAGKSAAAPYAVLLALASAMIASSI
jgi:hypothetical protein